MTPDDRDPVVNALFEGLESPAPPPQLRSRVLAAARELKTEKPDLWTRIWNQPGLRLAWAAAVVLLLAGHVLVIPRDSADIDVAENRVDEHLVNLLRPIRISNNAQPVVGMFAFAGDPSEPDVKGNPS